MMKKEIHGKINLKLSILSTFFETDHSLKDRYRVGLGGKIGLFYVLYNFTVGLKT